MVLKGSFWGILDLVRSGFRAQFLGGARVLIKFDHFYQIWSFLENDQNWSKWPILWSWSFLVKGQSFDRLWTKIWLLGRVRDILTPKWSKFDHFGVKMEGFRGDWPNLRDLPRVVFWWPSRTQDPTWNPKTTRGKSRQNRLFWAILGEF